MRVAYVGSHGYHGLLSVDPNSIPAQICASAAGCISGGTPGAPDQGHGAAGRAVHPGRSAGPIPIWAPDFFWYTEGNTSYNALQIDVIAPA